MRFGEHFLEELKARIRPSDVVGRHVKLKRQGREFAGLSPFTNEKTPSFFVNDEKGFYHCFSSGKHGDQISFLMEVEGLSFPEAVEALATMAGMEMPQADPQAEARAARNKETVSWMERAQEFYEKTLYRTDGEGARDYLKGRGLSKTAARAFGMGFAPDNFSALKDELIAQGARPEQLIEAGLLVEPEDRSRQPWDRFRDRIMFPIHDTRGRLVAFGGRAMAKDAKAKYLNSPETPIFQKSKLLYNYHRARKALAEPNNSARGMIVAEGYMDVIALARAGFTHAVAPMGTALTEDQLDLLWRVGPEPILCFDGDKAGVRAAFRSIERALPMLRPGQSLRFAMLPEGQDPDDLIRASGPPAMQQVLDKSKPLFEMLWRKEQVGKTIESPEDAEAFKVSLLAAANLIENESVRNQYRMSILDKYRADYGFNGRLRATLKGRNTKNTFSDEKADKSSQIATAKKLASNTRVETTLMGAILEFPELLERVDERLFELNFADAACAGLQRVVLDWWRQTKAIEKTHLHAHIRDQGLEQDYRVLSRQRLLIRAGMGGTDASLDDRAALWNAQADTLLGQSQTDADLNDTRARLVETISGDNSDGMHRAMRASKEARE